MPEINLDFTVETSNVNIIAETNPITITPTDIALNINAGGIAIPGGNPGELQYNVGGLLGGVANTNYDGNNLYLGDVDDVQIGGGINGYFLQTDGAGNLTWAAAGGGGNGSPGGSNTQIQYNDNGVFGGNVGFTFNEVTGNVTVPGSILAANLTANSNINAVNGGFTGYLTASNVIFDVLQVYGNILGNNISSNNSLIGNNITANSNISANNATFNNLTLNSNEIHLGNSAGANSQGAGSIAIGYLATPNGNGSNSIAIGSNAVSLGVQGNNAIAIGAGAAQNGQLDNTIAIGYRAGVDGVSDKQQENTIVINATGGTLVGNAYANALYVKPVRNANTANVVYYNNTTGEMTYSNIVIAQTANTVVDNAQPNITSVGNLIGLTVNGNILVSGYTSIQQALEKVVISNTAVTGNLTYNLSNGAIQFRTANATANFNLNFNYSNSIALTNVMSNGQSITCSFINTNGANAYVPLNITVDGNSATVLWSGSTGTALPGTISGKDLYTFNIIKDAGNFTVLSSRVGFV